MIFVTGSTGLVGSFLIPHLLENHASVIKCLIRKKQDESLFPKSDRLQFVIGDILDTTFLNKELSEVDVVIHCAGLVSYSPFQRDNLYNTNVIGTKNIVDSCLECQVKKLIHISSIAALGKPQKSNVINENTYWNASDKNSYYSETKYLAELEVFRGIEEGLKAVILNPSVILGPGDWNKSSTKLFKYVFDEKSYYLPKTTDFIDVRDLVKVIETFIQKDNDHPRYIVSWGACTYKKLFETMAGAFHKKAPNKIPPKWLINVLWRIEYIKGFILGKDPLITKETAQIASKSYTYDSKLLKDEVDMTFSNLKDTIIWSCEELTKKYSV